MFTVLSHYEDGEVAGTSKFCEFNWLENELLQYFITWKESTETRSGNFTLNAKSKMVVLRQPFEGIQVAVYSIIEGIKFLISDGMEFMLTEYLCQDPSEEYVSNQCGHTF